MVNLELAASMDAHRRMSACTDGVEPGHDKWGWRVLFLRPTARDHPGEAA